MQLRTSRIVTTCPQTRREGGGTAEVLQLFGSHRGASIPMTTTHECRAHHGPAAVRDRSNNTEAAQQLLYALSTPSQCHPRGVTRSD